MALASLHRRTSCSPSVQSAPISISGPRTTRQVEMEVTTPAGVTTRVFDFGGDDERVRSFATIAGLHLIRLALEAAG